LVVLGLVSSVVSADPIIDGAFDPSEGYVLHSILIDVENGPQNVPGGTFGMYFDAEGNLSIILVEPRFLNDNTFGLTSIGWGADSSSGKGHTLKSLLGSDDAQIQIFDASGLIVLDVNLDYISEVGTVKGKGGKKGKGKKGKGKTDKGKKGKKGKKHDDDPAGPTTTTFGSPGEYRSLGVIGGDGGVTVGSPGDVLAWGTSLDRNYNALGYGGYTVDSPATDASYTPNPDAPGWIYEIVWEIQIAASVFDNGFSGVYVPLVHASPNKLGGNKIYPVIGGPLSSPPPPPATPVPEPASLLLISGAAAGFLALRVRRARG